MIGLDDDLVATAADLPLDALAGGLRAWAAGAYTIEAAVELLIGHGSWLRCAEFLELVWVDDDLAGFDVDELAAMAILVPASASELAVLSLVLGLLGVPSPDSLAALLVGLDATNLALVLDAVARCGGWHERHTSHLTTGQFEEVDR